MSKMESLDCFAEIARIDRFLADTTRQLNRRGVVLGVSGGIDSAVCAALAAHALGRQRVFALLMPERESSDAGTERGRRLCAALDIPHAFEDITASLEAQGCYRRRDEAIRRLFPAFATGWRHKIVVKGTGVPHFDLIVEDPEGGRQSARLPADIAQQVIAATNFKQRTRKALEYYHAERLNYAVLGTPNRLEYELGFFVRGGDGLADVKPIAHLYKSEVYELAAHFGIAEEIRRQPPSTDTYTLPQTQEEFYFGLPTRRADQLLHALTSGLSAVEAARALDLDPAWVTRVFADFAGKRKVAARGLREAPVLSHLESAVHLDSAASVLPVEAGTLQART